MVKKATKCCLLSTSTLPARHHGNSQKPLRESRTPGSPGHSSEQSQSYKIVLMMRKALVTGSCGLIGSEVSVHLAQHRFQVIGIDNNERAVFFGPEGDTSWSHRRLRE